MERFEDGALLLRLEDRHLIELNSTACWILAHTDGQRSVTEVAGDLAERFQLCEAEAQQDTQLLYTQLSNQGVVESVKPDKEKKEHYAVTENSRYLRNPDVVLREEDKDGALLFNPDTNQVQVLNTTGLFIWKQCDGSHGLDEIAAAMQQAFGEDAPPAGGVTQDVQEFVEGMVAVGFIGTVEQWDAGE